MYKASLQVPHILLYKGLSHLLIFTTFFTVYTLSLAFTLCISLTCTLSSIQSGCHELSTLPEEAVTEVFIKHCNLQGAKDR